MPLTSYIVKNFIKEIKRKLVNKCDDTYTKG